MFELTAEERNEIQQKEKEREDLEKQHIVLLEKSREAWQPFFDLACKIEKLLKQENKSLETTINHKDYKLIYENDNFVLVALNSFQEQEINLYTSKQKFIITKYETILNITSTHSNIITKIKFDEEYISQIETFYTSMKQYYNQLLSENLNDIIVKIEEGKMFLPKFV